MTKEHWEWLKENDPITYYELRDDPTNGSDSYSFSMLIVCVCGILFVLLLIILILWKYLNL